jgi:hypothetical protein
MRPRYFEFSPDLIEVRRLTRFVLVDAPLCFGEDEDRDLVLDGE